VVSMQFLGEIAHHAWNFEFRLLARFFSQS